MCHRDPAEALLAGLGREILEFRVNSSPQHALATLRQRSIAGDDAFAVGARVTVPLHKHGAADALAALESDRVRASEIATRTPNLDDVYLKFTGGDRRSRPTRTTAWATTYKPPTDQVAAG